MPGKLDEISQAIGGLQSETKGLRGSFDRHCTDDDRRHEENVETLKAILSEQRKLTEKLTPLAESVAYMRPLVDSYQVTRWKAAGAVSVGSALLVGIGYLVWFIASELIKWGMPRH